MIHQDWKEYRDRLDWDHKRLLVRQKGGGVIESVVIIDISEAGYVLLLQRGSSCWIDPGDYEILDIVSK